MKNVYQLLSKTKGEGTLQASGLECSIRESIESVVDALPKFITLTSDKASSDKTCATEKLVRVIHSANFLQLPLQRLNLPARGRAIVRRLRLSTLADLFDYGLHNLREFKNVGEITCRDIEKAILEQISSQRMNGRTGIGTLLANLLPKVPGRRDIVKARFGFGDGKGQTLQKIGHQFGFTRERIRQIIADELANMTAGTPGVALNLLQQKVDAILIRVGGVVALEDIVRQEFFRRERAERVSFTINVLTAVFPDKYRIVDGKRLTILSVVRQIGTDSGMRVRVLPKRVR